MYNLYTSIEIIKRSGVNSGVPKG